MRIRAAGGLLLAACLSVAIEAAGTTRFGVDASRSEATFLMHTTWHDVVGRTKAVTGVVTTESGELFKDGRVRVTIDAASLDTGNKSRDRTMREDHLETAKFPSITFESTAPPALARGAGSPAAGAPPAGAEIAFTVAGDLTIHGVKRSVTLPATARREDGGWAITGKLPVKLSDHGIPDPSIMFNRVKDEVTVSFTVHLTASPG